MPTLNKDECLNYLDYEVRQVKVWGGEIRVRSMDIEQLFKFNSLLDIGKKTGNYTECHVWAAIWCVVDLKDEPIFTEEDYKKISKKSQKSLSAIFKAVVDMNTTSDEKTEDLKKS